jgi:uncharacterized membrane protein YgcG
MYDELINGGIAPQQTETGFIGGLIDSVSDIGKTISGENLKLARAQTAQAQEATRQAELAVEAARLQAEAAALGIRQPAPGLMAHRTFGVPTVALVGAAAVAAFLLLRKK